MYFVRGRAARLWLTGVMLCFVLGLMGILIYPWSLQAAVLPAGTVPAQATAGIPTGLQDYERWFGSSHSHINMEGDDGAAGSTATQAFNYARNLPHLQFFVVSPHLHAERSGSATLYTEATYDLIRAQAVTATTANFVAVAALEVGTISKGGHWNLFNAQDLVGQDHPNGDWNDADDYYDHVVGLGAAGENVSVQYNHPHTTDFGNRYDAAAAPYVGTLAVSSGPAYSAANDFSDDGGNDEVSWEHFLNLGWKLAPTADQDNHLATWGASSSEYTVIVRPQGTALTRDNVVRGMREHMTYATEDANMQIAFVANGWSMGQTIGGGSTVAFTIWWNNPSATIYNNNNGVARAEGASDAIKNIWIYKNGFTTPVASYQPNSVGGSWSTSLPAAQGDWFIVKFEDSSSLASGGRTTDFTWSAPVWYDPARADVPITVGGGTVTPVAGVTLNGPAGAATGVATLFTATAAPVSATQPITYVWQATGQGTVTHTGGLNDSATFQWGTPGSYVVTVTVSNISATVQSTRTVSVSVVTVGVTGVTLTGPSSTAVGVTAGFSATAVPVSATLPITYVWEATGQGIVTHTGGQSDGAAFSWGTPGSYVVTVTASNISATVRSTRTVTVQAVPVALAGVTLTGPATVTTGMAALFTANVAPVEATAPITYVWEALGQGTVTHTGSLNDNATFVWGTPGSYVVTVTASNISATVRSTRTVVVPAGVAVANVGLAGPVTATAETVVVFTATVAPASASEPITYFWEATGQAPVLHTDAGTMDTVMFQWLVVGNQVITVTAVNAEGSAQTTYTVGIAAPPAGRIGSAQLSGPYVVMFGNPVTFTVVLGAEDAATPLSYGWQATGQAAVTHTHSSLTDTVSFRWTDPGEKEVVLVVWNAVDQVVVRRTVNVAARWFYLPIIMAP